MKRFVWNDEKNKKLKETRNITFEMVVEEISKGNLVDTILHPNKSKYPHQKVFVIRFENYIYLVPFVETENEYFLKTIFPSREAQKRYGENR